MPLSQKVLSEANTVRVLIIDLSFRVALGTLGLWSNTLSLIVPDRQ